MNLEYIRDYYLKKSFVTEEYPFDEVTLVFKVKGKIFALMAIDEDPLWLNLKCEPELAIELRERYESITPGYHMNKKMWNTIILDDTIPAKEILKMIDHSYDEVLKKIPEKRKQK
jgi:predicted DNA-binding protein (MmcQ/YjbR family)